MPRAYLKWGDWNAICDVCGFRCKASEMKKRWDGLMVCPQDYELRQPQDFLRVRGDQPAVPWTRPEPEDTFIFVCWVWAITAYADLGEADCMKADNTAISYQVAFSLKYTQPDGSPGYPFQPPNYFCTIPGATSFPSFATAGCMLPSNTTGF